MSLKSWWRGVRPKVLPPIIYAVANSILSTMRIRSEGFERYDKLEKGRIYCGWHGLTMTPARFFRNRGMWVIISHSKDGEMQTRIFERFGCKVIRGSTGRGGERALVESIRVLRGGGEMAVTPDGPRGPSEVVQPGVLLMAKKSGCLLVPTGVAVSPCTRVKTWDRYVVPWFFSRALMAFGEPIEVPADADDALMEAKRLELENAIKALQAETERRV